MQQQTNTAKQADSSAPAVKKTAAPIGDGTPRSPSTAVMNGHDHAPHAASDRPHSESDEEEDRDEVGDARARMLESICRYSKSRRAADTASGVNK